MWGSRKGPRGDSGDIVIVKKVDVEKGGGGADHGHAGGEKKPAGSPPSFWIQVSLWIQLFFHGALFVLVVGGVGALAYYQGRKHSVPITIICPKGDVASLHPVDPIPGDESSGESPAGPSTQASGNGNSKPMSPEGSGKTALDQDNVAPIQLKADNIKITVDCIDTSFAPDGDDEDDGSQYYRQSPGADAVRPKQGAGQQGGLAPQTQDGLAASCNGATQGDCKNRWRMLKCSDQAQYWLKQGESALALGNVAEAKFDFNEALRVGRKCGSEYSVTAAKRLSALNLTCEYTPASLARIARGFGQVPAGNQGGGDVVDLRLRQQALKALGHYAGKVNGEYDAATRAAIQNYQRDFGFSETGDLTPIETVYLFCAAAQNANDVTSTTVLGVMYVAGLGVAQNTDIGLRWLKEAAARGSPDSLYNLAVIYGSGIVLSSYRICEVVQSEQIADAYLTEAAKLGHPEARRLYEKYQSLNSIERWQRIKSEELERVAFYQTRLENVGHGCEPNGPPREKQSPKR